MRPEEQIINSMKFEVNKLRESQAFMKYVELMGVINEGRAIETIIKRKIQSINRKIIELKKIPEEDEEYAAVGDEYEDEEPQPVKKQVPKMRREERPAVTHERERELDKKVKSSVKDYEAEAHELGLDEDIPGMPDNLDDLEDDVPTV